MTERSSASQLYLFRFGQSEFDESSFQLTVNGVVADVQRRPLEVLAQLLRHPGEVVSREELLQKLWDGRFTVEHVINNAVVKLRTALGPIDGARIVTKPRVGYLFTGPLEKVAVGRRQVSAFQFEPGAVIPKRENFRLDTLLGQSGGNEVWLGVHAKTGERRVYKFCLDGESLVALKRESSLHRVLRASLGERDDFVKLLDWNFESAPFFLEYAWGGENLARWAESGPLAALDRPQRIELFLRIADAVAAAHSVGVLHKDLKPANILIASEGGAPQARVADFGSGRLLEHAEIADITHHDLGQTIGAHAQSIAGTALYIAPELMRGKVATIQSDVYALGIMLYQIAADRIGEPLVPGWERAIGDPLLASDIADATDGDVQRRIPSVSVLTERLRKLEDRRREALHLAQSEERRLAAERLEQTRRARRPWIVAAFALLLVGLATSTSLYVREARTHDELLISQQLARQEAERAESVLRFLQDDVLSAGDPFQGDASRAQTIEAALSDAVNRLDQHPPKDASTEASLRMTLGSILVSVAEPSVAEAQWRRVVALLSKSGDLAQLAQSHYALAQALTVQSRYPEAAKELSAGDDIRKRLATGDARTARMAEAGWGTFYMDQQQCGKAIPHLEQALTLASAGDDRNYWEGDLARISLGQCYTGASRFKDAERLSHDQLNNLAARSNPSALTKALAQSVYGESLMYQGKYADAGPPLDEAYRVMTEKLGLANIRTISVLSVRCNLLFMSQKLDESLACLTKAHEATREHFGENNWATWAALSNIGTVQFMLGQYSKSAKTLEAARGGLEKSLGVDRPATLLANYYLAYSLLKLHQAARAEPLLARLVASGLEEAEPGAPWSERLALLHGLIDIDLGRRDKGRALIEQTLRSAAIVADSLDTIVTDARRAVGH